LLKNALSCSVEESFKKFLDPDPEADDIENLITSSLSTDTSVAKFSGRSVQQVFRKVANRQTDRQTEKRRAFT